MRETSHRVMWGECADHVAWIRLISRNWPPRGRLELDMSMPSFNLSLPARERQLLLYNREARFQITHWPFWVSSKKDTIQSTWERSAYTHINHYWGADLSSRCPNKMKCHFNITYLSCIALKFIRSQIRETFDYNSHATTICTFRTS